MPAKDSLTRDEAAPASRDASRPAATAASPHAPSHAPPPDESPPEASPSPPRWRFGLCAALLLAVVAFVPQVHLWAVRGREWQGQYASFQPDETAYSAYVNALNDGRPRRSDPYTGRDADLEAARAETLFSVQFLPPYALSLAARALRLSASAVFILLAPLAAFAAALALFWLLLAATRGDARFAAAAALAVLCLGGVATGHKLLDVLAGVEISHTPLPFLRRYVPAAPFPLLFVFCALTYRALFPRNAHDADAHDARDDSERDNGRRTITRDGGRPTITRAWIARVLGAGLCFAALVYSYFYLWTAALAWLACLALVTLAAARRGRERAHASKTFAALAALAAAALGPYALLLARRAPALDAAQGLIHTRAPDPLQVSELAGLLVLAALALCARRRLLSLRDPAALLAASFALLPFAVFNQQLLTGRTLQPLHYELFVTNYCWPLAAALTLRLARRRATHARADELPAAPSSDATPAPDDKPFAPSSSDKPFIPPSPRLATTRDAVGGFSARALACAAAAALAVGAFESVAATRLTARRNLLLDEARPPLLRLAEIARAEPESARAAVFYADFRQADLAPTVAPQPTLWALHTFSFSGVSPAEERERLYQQLYFSGFDPDDFLRLLERRTFLLSAVFGWTRALEGWDAHLPPITRDEMLAEARAYQAYLDAFTPERAARFPLGFAVVPADTAFDYSRVERFYERDAGTRAGNYLLHRVRLRPH